MWIHAAVVCHAKEERLMKCAYCVINDFEDNFCHLRIKRGNEVENYFVKRTFFVLRGGLKFKLENSKWLMKKKKKFDNYFQIKTRREWQKRSFFQLLLADFLLLLVHFYDNCWMRWAQVQQKVNFKFYNSIILYSFLYSSSLPTDLINFDKKLDIFI